MEGLGGDFPGIYVRHIKLLKKLLDNHLSWQQGIFLNDFLTFLSRLAYYLRFFL